MANEDPVRLALPDPPPPSPARREAAIEAAMRGFDGVEGPARTANAARPAGWWGRVNRQQIGALAAAALVAAIFAPVAWMTSTQPTTPSADRVASVDAGKSGSRTFEVAEAPPPPSVATAPVATEPPLRPRPESSPAGSPPVPATSEAVGTAANVAPSRQVLAEAETAPVAAAPAAAPSPIVTEDRREAAGGGAFGALARADRAPASARAAPAPPPPPPPAPAAERAREEAFDSIVVTSAKRKSSAPAEHGEWTACTVNDPRRSLSACKSLINPAAKGGKGQAAAFMADGLSAAWRGDMAAAIAAFDRAIAISPRLSLAYLNRGLVRQRQGELETALADLDRAVRYAPREARGYYNRSLLLREQGKDRRASADEQRAVELDR